ncbi:MAG: ABC transporter ATP-binding protein [Abditibacteriales bacterium]|nr:ABC transporter ATP-binding protein [Abditibacteriales bacterium]MDW8365572.1 ABC transporter ATP-binding protein [Abditibacteriales bacterium]
MTIHHPLITFSHADLGYRRPVLRDVNVTVSEGDFLGIVGPNGSGKTTLLRAALGTLQPLSGTVTRRNGIRFGYVPQRQVVDEMFPLSVLDIVLMGRYRHIGLCRRPSRADRDYALACLDNVGIADLAQRAYQELSGGQKQRALLARALAAQPTVLVLDEPTTDMDIPSERSIMELVSRLSSERHLTVLIVSHLLHVIVNYANRIAFVGEGQVIVQDTAEAIRPENLSRLYGIEVFVGEIEGRKFVL